MLLPEKHTIVASFETSDIFPSEEQSLRIKVYLTPPPADDRFRLNQICSSPSPWSRICGLVTYPSAQKDASVTTHNSSQSMGQCQTTGNDFFPENQLELQSPLTMDVKNPLFRPSRCPIKTPMEAQGECCDHAAFSAIEKSRAFCTSKGDSLTEQARAKC